MNKKLLILTAIIMILLLSSVAYAARKTSDEPAQKEGIGSQFAGSFKCILMGCGWPAIVILILPPIAVYMYKKFFWA